MQLEPQQLLTDDLPIGLRLLRPASIALAVLLVPFVFTQLLAHGMNYHSALGPRWLDPPSQQTMFVKFLALGLLSALLFYRYGSIRPCLWLLPPAGVLAVLAAVPLYSPAVALQQWFPRLLRNGQGRRLLFESLLTTVVVSAGVVAVAMLFTKILRRRNHPSRIAHGSARYAEYGDLKNAGMLQGGGVYLGTFRHRGRLYPLTDDSQHHTLFVMPSGAGKTAGHIIPSLLTRTHSAFVLDPKGELYRATAGWRAAQGHRCIRLAPLALEDPGECWNPLLEIEPGTDDIGAIALLAEALITSTAVEDSHWDESARALFRCFALHSLYAGEPPSFEHIRALAHASGGIDRSLKDLLETEHDPTGRFAWWDSESGDATKTHPEAALLARGFLDTPSKEMGSIASTLRRALGLWGDSKILAATGHSDFDLGVFNRPEPVTLYVEIPYSDLHRLAPWVRILLASLMRRITYFRNVEEAPPLDLYLDEFASLGRVTVIHQILSFLRGYGVRAHIVIQSYDDLERLYGKGENISACQIHAVAATQSRSSRRFISDLAGEATVQWERRSKSGARTHPIHTRENRSPTETRRPLITQGEVGTLAPDEILIAKTGLPLIRAKKRFYFRDRVLARRASIAPPEPEQLPMPPRPRRWKSRPSAPEEGGPNITPQGERWEVNP